jgi:hypothetical protein
MVAKRGPNPVAPHEPPRSGWRLPAAGGERPGLRARPPRTRAGRTSQAAFTLAELVIALTLFGLVLSGLIAGHIYGLRLLQIVNPKLQASDEARAAVARMVGDIRAARVIRIGTGTLSSFAEFAPEIPQQGNSILVYPSLDTNTYVRYFLDPLDNKLKRTTNSTTAVQVMANSVSNLMVFTSEDHAGRILTNNHDNRVIGVKLEFYQIEYPRTAIGSGGYYDYYQLHTKITRRSIL